MTDSTRSEIGGSNRRTGRLPHAAEAPGGGPCFVVDVFRRPPGAGRHAAAVFVLRRGGDEALAEEPEAHAHLLAFDCDGAPTLVEQQPPRGQHAQAERRGLAEGDLGERRPRRRPRQHVQHGPRPALLHGRRRRPDVERPRREQALGGLGQQLRGEVVDGRLEQLDVVFGPRTGVVAG